MAHIDNQSGYWDAVATNKTFTHPIDLDLLQSKFEPTETQVLDYGCGYGRLTSQVSDAGFKHIIGVDTSLALVKRGKELFPKLDLRWIESPGLMPFAAESFDLVLLFAVLTCIPSNAGQKSLIHMLRKLLKPGGALYISDYYLQRDRSEVGAYQSLGGDPSNYGVFILPEGVTFRHHTREWIHELLADFMIDSHQKVEVNTMNGHVAEAFQILAFK